MAKTGPQKYPGASLAYWHQGAFPGSAMESNVGVIHTTEGTSVPSYGGGGSAPNFTALPDIPGRRLRWYQHFDFDVSSRALRNLRGGVETNTLNAVQIELVGTCDPRYRSAWGTRQAGRDYLFWPDVPDWALAELAKFVRWAHEEHGIPLAAVPRWLPYPQSYGANGVRLSGAAWQRFTGWLGHQHVPENDHGDPGDIDFARVLELAAPPPPAATPEEDPMPTPKSVNLGRPQPMRVPRRSWDAIEYTEEWDDQPDAHFEGGSQFVRGPGMFVGEVDLVVHGLPAGAVMHVRLSEVEGGEYVANHPSHDVVSAGERTNVKIPITGRVNGGRGVRVRVWHDSEGTVTVTSVLKALVWEG